MKESTCNHIVMAEDNAVILTNDDDSYYCQYFNSWDEIQEFIIELKLEAFKAFGDYPDLQVIDAKTGKIEYSTNEIQMKAYEAGYQAAIKTQDKEREEKLIQLLAEKLTLGEERIREMVISKFNGIQKNDFIHQIQNRNPD